jgi:peptidoglycan LD-endopeptidase CwlK
MDARSEKNLEHVHPDLAKVVRRAWLKCTPSFVVICGLRTVAEEAHNCAAGTSQTMHSRHLPNEQGLACAVDVMALTPNDAADWAPAAYQPIAAAMLEAGHTFGVPIEWGGNWHTLKDWGHFQLPWAVYP